MKTTIRCLACLAAGALAFAPRPALSLDNNSAPSAHSSNLDLARQLNDAFVEVAEKVTPTVVVINVVQKPTPQSTQEQDDSQDPLDPYRRFFRRQQQEPEEGQGSGIIIRKDGYILTNRHVVEDAETITVRLKDGRSFNATVRGTDTPADVAVIKIDADDLPVAKLADSDKTRVGEFAIAIGAPYALDYSVTFGHVSAKNRTDILPFDDAGSTMTDQSFIQTDANINPGNSGGPLVNIDGEVIGINTLIRGLRTGIGFAIPSNLAREISEKIISDGKFPRAWLGITIGSLQDNDSDVNDLRAIIERATRRVSSDIKTTPDGVVVRDILPGGPASGSKLRDYDLITAVDGRAVLTPQDLKGEIRSKKVGQNVTLDVVRVTNDSLNPVKVVVQPGEWVDDSNADNSDGSQPSDNVLGLSIRPLSPALAKKLKVNENVGVLVAHVDRDGLAFASGIQEGDIITSIDERPVANARQFLEAMREVNTKKGARVRIITDGASKLEILKESPQ